MKACTTKWLALRFLLLCSCIGMPAFSDSNAQNADELEVIKKLSALPWLKGPAQGAISGVATIKIADDERFLGSAATRQFLQLLGYPPSQDSFVLARKDLSWASAFRFYRDGYVRDDDKIDPNLLLKQLEENNQRSNEERKKQGLEPLYLDGWFVPPRYDVQTHQLEWGTRIRDENGSHVANFTSRLLGRNGVMTVLRLRQFADEAIKTGIHAQQPVGALPIGHGLIRSVPILLIHGHDTLSRLDLENFFFRKLPHVAPLSMILETNAAATLPEKFEELASQVNGAIAILSPDDIATTLRSGESAARARQNVVIEVGWFWGRLGRDRCLLLMKDMVEIPSDLNGVEIHKFRESPVEQSEAIRGFVDTLSVA